MATKKIGSRTRSLLQKSSKEFNVVKISVNHNGGMGGGYEEFYCEDTIDFMDKNGLFLIKTILGNELYVNTQWISTIKKKKLVAVEHIVRKWNESKREYYVSGDYQTLYYLLDRNDDYELIGFSDGIECLNMNF